MTVGNCDNCGVCCMGQNLLPLALLSEEDAAFERIAAGPLAGDDRCPCIWLDRETGQCRNYESRPQICRDTLQPGDETCLRLRRDAGIED